MDRSLCLNIKDVDSSAKSLNNEEATDDGITAGDDPELYQFYYHADHLGSASYITNLDGEIAQHIEYVPFGGVFLEERNNKWNSPYLFNGKGRDEETGLSYYGARYYNPRVSPWISVDPLAEEMPSWSPYNYVFNNPLKYTDPTGVAPEWVPDSNDNLIAEKGDNASDLRHNDPAVSPDPNTGHLFIGKSVPNPIHPALPQVNKYKKINNLKHKN